MAPALGADAVGFVFAPSARQVSVGTVRDIGKRLPPEVVTVGVFRDQSPRMVIDTVLDAGPDVFAHNLETVPRLSRQVRVQASVERSLAVLDHARKRGALTKSGLMLGLGETEHEDVARFESDHQRSFSVESPNSTSRMVMIQKRTTTCVSFQPPSSK